MAGCIVRQLLFCTFVYTCYTSHYNKRLLTYLPSECQTVWIQIRPDIMSGLIWVQTICKGYQQSTLGGKDLNLHLGDNCIQNFHLGRYIMRYTVGNLVLWRHVRKNYRDAGHTFSKFACF